MLEEFAGSTLGTDGGLNPIPSLQAMNDSVGSLDPRNYYSFTPSGSSFNLSLNGISVDADLEPLNSIGELLQTSAQLGTDGDIYTSLAAGTYYTQVYPGADANPNYNLHLNATSSQSTDPLINFGNEFSRSDQPLVGVIDTGFSANNPDIDYSRMILGRDRIDGDDDPLLAGGVDAEHGTHVLDIIAATPNNSIGIDGINDDALLWVGRAVGSGKWAESLVEFIETAKAYGQPNAVVNLSFDLIQTNPDGSVTTRNELTPQEQVALEYAHQNGVLIVVAAGNEGGVMSALGQASQEFDNIITVGAADGLDRANYSSYGNGLTLLAEEEMGNLAGTSVAAAKVTGAASEVWAANPQLDYRQVIEILKDTATDLQAPGWDDETGVGLLNQEVAIGMAAETTPVLHEKLLEATSPSFIDQVTDNFALERSAFDWPNPIDWLRDGWDALTDAYKEILGPVKWLYEKTGDTYQWAFDKVGDGYNWAFSQVGLDSVGNFLDKEVFEQAGDKLKGILLREVQWMEKLPDRIERFGSNFFSDFWNDGGFWEGLGKWIGRNYINALEITGYPEIAETAADMLKFNTRPLTQREVEVAKSVFGDSINYDMVRIDEWSFSIPILKDVRGGNDPFTTLHTINTWGPMEDHTLIHELAHVWQYENRGARYIPEALDGQTDPRILGIYPPGIDPPGKSGYDYGGATELQTRKDSGQSITTFNLEQQAKIVEHYFEIRQDLNLNNDLYLSLYADFVQEVSTLSENQLAKLPTDSGNTLSTARNLDLSSLNGTVTLREFVGDRRFFGWTLSSDEADVYRLNNLTSGNLNLTLTGMTADADIQVIRDVNGNGIVDDGEVIASSTLGGSEDEAINLMGLEAGDYFVEVYRYSGDTNYNLNIST